ncbi:hypothetical protein HDU98_000426, partial [Podochytrium sp. JEL0797]
HHVKFHHELIDEIENHIKFQKQLNVVDYILINQQSNKLYKISVDAEKQQQRAAQGCNPKYELTFSCLSKKDLDEYQQDF